MRMMMASTTATTFADDELSRFQDRVTEQDRVVVESQRPELLPLDLQAELHLRSDRMAIAYRKWLRKIGLHMARHGDSVCSGSLPETSTASSACSSPAFPTCCSSWAWRRCAGFRCIRHEPGAARRRHLRPRGQPVLRMAGAPARAPHRARRCHRHSIRREHAHHLCLCLPHHGPGV